LHLVEFLILIKNILFINSESKYLGVKLQLETSKGVILQVTRITVFDLSFDSGFDVDYEGIFNNII